MQLVAIWKRDFFDRMATYLVAGGLASGFVTYIAGKIDEEYAENRFGESAEALIETHESLAIATLILFGVVLLLKLIPGIQSHSFIRIPIVIFSVVGFLLISITGHYGGKIVYGDHQVPAMGKMKEYRVKDGKIEIKYDD